MIKKACHSVDWDLIEAYVHKPLTLETILELQALCVEAGIIKGFRTGIGAPPVYDTFGNSVYWAPDSGFYHLDREVENIFDWCDQDNSAVGKATRFHWGLVKIHPFYDGNGRTARMIMFILLRQYGYDQVSCKRLEAWIKNNTAEYYQSLDDGDFTYRGLKNENKAFRDLVEQGLK